MANNKQFKHFPIDSELDGLSLLCTLISGISANLEKYKEYSDEAFDLFQKNNEKEYVTAKEYDDINDKLLYRQREIIMLFAEEQKDSFSYKSIREKLVKKGYLPDDLSQEKRELLNEFLNIRNLSFHNTYSYFMAKKEACKNNVPEPLKPYVEVITIVNPVTIYKMEKYSIPFLGSLCLHTFDRIEQFELLLSSIKEDYQKVYSRIPITPENARHGVIKKDVDYIVEKQVGLLESSSFDASQVAMAIQKGKYDGTKEKFDEVTLKNNNI